MARDTFVTLENSLKESLNIINAAARGNPQSGPSLNAYELASFVRLLTYKEILILLFIDALDRLDDNDVANG